MRGWPDSFVDWFQLMMFGRFSADREHIAMILLRIWQVRNSIVWKDRSLSPSKAVLYAKNSLEQWTLAQSLRVVHRHATTTSVALSWTKAGAGWPGERQRRCRSFLSLGVSLGLVVLFVIMKGPSWQLHRTLYLAVFLLQR